MTLRTGGEVRLSAPGTACHRRCIPPVPVGSPGTQPTNNRMHGRPFDPFLPLSLRPSAVYHERGTKHYSSAALLSGPSSVPSPPGQAPSLTDMMEGLTVTGGTEDDAATVSDRGSLSPSTEPCDPRRARRTTGDMMGMSFSSLKALYREVLGRTYKGMRHKKLVIAAIEDAWRQEDLLASP